MPARSSETETSGPLTRARIATAALEIADKEGVDRLSMRRLAEELGSGTMTLYGHFGNKQELLDAVIDVAGSGTDPPELRGSWRDKTHQLIAHSRELFQRHPSVVEIWARQPVLGRVGLRWPEAGLQVLDEAGFPPDEAVVAFRLLVNYLYGFAVFSTPRSGQGSENTQNALSALPPDEFPHLSRAAETFARTMGTEETFKYGLDRILDGLEERLETLKND